MGGARVKAILATLTPAGAASCPAATRCRAAGKKAERLAHPAGGWWVIDESVGRG